MIPASRDFGPLSYPRLNKRVLSAYLNKEKIKARVFSLMALNFLVYSGYEEAIGWGPTVLYNCVMKA